MIRTFDVKVVERNQIKDFIEENHYSHNINGVISDLCFGLYNQNELIGAAIFGRMAMRNAYKKYWDVEDEIVELRRLVCIDNTPKNTESFFIGKMLRYLQRNTSYKIVISYADSTYGHTGVIYKASNFVHKGCTKGMRVIKRKEDGKLFHDKTIRTKYKGKLKPFAEKLKLQLQNGEAEYVNTQPKHIYTYTL